MAWAWKVGDRARIVEPSGLEGWGAAHRYGKVGDEFIVTHILDGGLSLGREHGGAPLAARCKPVIRVAAVCRATPKYEEMGHG